MIYTTELAVLSESLLTVRSAKAAANGRALQDLNEAWEIGNDEMKLHCISGKPVELGRGGYGIVLWGTLYREDAAIKIIKGVDQEQEMLREITMLARANTKYVVRFMGYRVSPDGILLAMEYMQGGDLYTALRHGDEFQWNNRLVFQN